MCFCSSTIEEKMAARYEICTQSAICGNCLSFDDDMCLNFDECVDYYEEVCEEFEPIESCIGCKNCLNYEHKYKLR